MRRRQVRNDSCIILCVTLVGFLGTATDTVEAANWFKLRGTEPGSAAKTIRLWGFIQPTYAKDYSNDIDGAVGLLANRNGTAQVPGTIPPDRTNRDSVYLRRARPGARGTLNPISKKIDYFILTEFGRNGINRNDGAIQLLDGSVTFNHLSRGLDENGLHNLGARFRAGQYLFSQTSESLSHSTPGRRVHIFMAEATFQTAMRRIASDNGRMNFPEDEVAMTAGRDTGIEVFDFAEFPAKSGGPWEFTYSAALGNGTTIGEWNRDGNHRQYYWLSFAKLFDKTRGPRRHDAMMYGWFQKGDMGFNPDIDNDGVSDREVGATGPLNPGDLTIGPISPGQRLVKNGNEQDIEQKYWGFGVEYFDRPFENFGQIRLEAEYQKQEGLIFDGAQSPSSQALQEAGGTSSILHDFDGENEGWYVDVGYDIHRHLGLKKRTTINLRYDEFDRNKGNVKREANWKIWTLTGEYFLHKNTRLTITYQWRDVSADKRIGVARTNGNAALKQLDQRLGIQVTYVLDNVFTR